MSNSEGNNIFSLKNITYAYPLDKPVLKDISLEIKSGERIAILGVNGCGKSTLLKLLSGLIFAQSGSFHAFEQSINEKYLGDDRQAKAYHQRVGFIFQDSDIQLFCSTVEEEIAFGPLQLGLSAEETQTRIDDVIAILGIEQLRGRTPFKLSGGEKKKVAIAAILAMNPQVLILDEPTNGLDPRTQRWLVGLLNTLNKAGKTLISSTHNLELVQEISDRAILFGEHHEIVADMPTGKLFEDIDLLKRVNLVDEFYHRHEGSEHSHFHIQNY